MEVEVRTALIAKYLPDHQVIARLRSPGRRGIIVRDTRTGRSVSLNEEWSAKPMEEGSFLPSSVSDFIATLDIRIADRRTAIEIAQLIEDITASPNEIQCLMFNKRNYRLFDDRAYTSRREMRKHWDYAAKREKNMWVVVVSHVGPTDVSIMEPPVYEIQLTQDLRFAEIRWRM